MRHLIIIIFTAISINAVGQVNPNYNPDYNGDDFIGIDDILGILTQYDNPWSSDIVSGCTYSDYLEYNPIANDDDGSCMLLSVPGCTDPDYYEYNEAANEDDGSCLVIICPATINHANYDYSLVHIGDQCWFSENCRYLPVVSPSNEGSDTDPYYYVYDYQGDDVEAAKATSNYETYGVLYNWPAVMTDDICPSGWHIPTEPEWQTLEMELGMSVQEVLSTEWRGTDQGSQLKSTAGWANGGNGSNSSGFNGLPGGFRYTGGFNVGGSYIYLWSSSESGSSAWVRLLGDDYDQVYRYDGGTDADDNLHLGFSVRCVQD